MSSFLNRNWAFLIVFCVLVFNILYSNALICPVEAPYGLKAAIDEIGDQSGDDAVEERDTVYALSLCKVPYLVNAQLTPSSSYSVGLYSGGTISIDLELLPGKYVNNEPLKKPRQWANIVHLDGLVETTPVINQKKDENDIEQLNIEKTNVTTLQTEDEELLKLSDLQLFAAFNPLSAYTSLGRLWNPGRRLSEFQGELNIVDTSQSNYIGDDLQVAVNNTYVLVMDQLQFLVFQAQQNWMASLADKSGIVANSYAPSLMRFPFNSSRLNVQVKVPRLDRYSVVLLNADGLDLHLRGSITFLNPDGEHLPAEQLALPDTVLFCSILNFLTCITLLFTYTFRWRQHGKSFFWYFLGFFILAWLSSGFDWFHCTYTQKYGVRSAFYWIVSRLLRKFLDLWALLVFILLSLGYITFRDHLTRVEIQFIAGLAVISIYLGIFEVVIGGLQEGRYLFHASGYMCTLVAIHFSLAILRGQLSAAPISSDTAKVYSKYLAFKTYRWLVFVFLMKPVALLFIKIMIPSPVHQQLFTWDEWVCVLLDNVVDWGIFVALTFAFRPTKGFHVIRYSIRDS